MSKPTETIENDDDVFMDDFDENPKNNKSELKNELKSDIATSDKTKLEISFMDKVKNYVAKNKTKVYKFIYYIKWWFSVSSIWSN